MFNNQRVSSLFVVPARQKMVPTGLIIASVREKDSINATSFGAFLVLKYIFENGNPYEKTVLRSPAVNMYNVVCNSLITPEISEKLSKLTKWNMLMHLLWIFTDCNDK